MTKKLQLTNWLQQLANKKLVGLTFGVFFPRARPGDGKTFELALITDHSSPEKIVTSGDGAVEVRSMAISPMDAGELGELVVTDAIPAFDTRRVKNCVIQGADIFTEQQTPVGFELRLSSGACLLVLNAGDEMFVLLDGDHPFLHELGVVRERLF